METPTEQPKRGRGRPKKVVTEPEIKRKVGRPKKEKTEETPKRPVGRPRKILLTSTAPEPSPAGGSPILAKPIVTETAPAGPVAAGGGRPMKPEERAALDRIDAMLRQRELIDVTLPSPPSEVEVPSDEEEQRRVFAVYEAQVEAKKERERRRKEKERLENVRKALEAEEERERLYEETGFVDPDYVKFRRSFNSEEAYDHWEERVIDKAMYGKAVPYVIRFVTHHGRRRVVEWKLDKPEDKMVLSTDWKNARKGKQPTPGGGALLGYVGSGEFRDLVLPP